jgi:hypothetical protein
MRVERFRQKINPGGIKMRQLLFFGAAVVSMTFLAGPVGAQEKKAEKAKAQKVAGDIGLLDTEKNYMIVVTKEGKLVTVDYTAKTKVTELKPSQAKMSDIGLGSKAAVEYVEKGGKNVLTKIEFMPAKGE